MGNTIKVGTIVQLWCNAAYFGVVTKVNKVTFVVEHNLHGRTRYRTSSLTNNLDVTCEKNVFRGTLIPPEKINTKLFGYLYYHQLYRGRWWGDVESQLISLYKEYYHAM